MQRLYEKGEEHGTLWKCKKAGEAKQQTEAGAQSLWPSEACVPAAEGSRWS